METVRNVDTTKMFIGSATAGEETMDHMNFTTPLGLTPSHENPTPCSRTDI